MTNTGPNGPRGPRRVFIHVDASSGTGWVPKLLALLLGLAVLACILLLVLGLWLLFALALVVVAAVGIFQALISRNSRAKSVAERNRLDDRSQ